MTTRPLYYATIAEDCDTYVFASVDDQGYIEVSRIPEATPDDYDAVLALIQGSRTRPLQLARHFLHRQGATFAKLEIP